MNIQEMHYDFKRKLNKLDSEGNRNLLIPEIDWVLNEALTTFISHSASPRVRTNAGFEKSQRITDDIYPLVVKDKPLVITDDTAVLPDDYMFYISLDAIISKGTCSEVSARVTIQQQDDMFEEDPFSQSSFSWRVVNGVFKENGIFLYHNGFDVNKALLSYVRKHPYICFPSGFSGGSYAIPGRTELLTKDVSCILPEHTHSEIVDIAVAMASSEIGLPETTLKFNKLQFNQFQ